MELLENKETITTLELLKQINLFRAKEENKSELGHNDLLKVIRDEFEEEIGMGEISHTPYIHPQNGQKYPMFELTIPQAKQVLVRESKFVRKAIIKYLDELEKLQTPKTFSQALLLASKQAEKIEQQKLLISEQTPKVIAFENIIDNANTYTLDTVSDILNIGRTTLCKLLEDKKWKTVKDINGTSSTRYAEENNYAKTVYEYIKVGKVEIKTKRIVLKKKGLDILIKQLKNE